MINGRSAITGEEASANAIIHEWRQGEFFIEVYGDETFPGWTDGEPWNGWATPHFEAEAARSIMLAHNNRTPLNPNDRGRAWYDDLNDRFVFVAEGTDQEEEYYGGYTKLLGGQLQKLYDIGTGYWIWEEYVEGER